MNHPPVANTDRELFREREGDYYAPSVHVTREGSIGMNVGGHVIVLPIREWWRRARELSGGPLPTVLGGPAGHGAVVSVVRDEPGLHQEHLDPPYPNPDIGGP